MPSSSPYATVNGLETYCGTHGAAPVGNRPLVLLRGGGLTVDPALSAFLSTSAG